MIILQFKEVSHTVNNWQHWYFNPGFLIISNYRGQNSGSFGKSGLAGRVMRETAGPPLFCRRKVLRLVITLTFRQHFIIIQSTFTQLAHLNFMNTLYIVQMMRLRSGQVRYLEHG